MVQVNMMISIDPGITTGLVIAKFSSMTDIKPVVAIDSRDISVIIDTVNSYIETHGAEVIIVEDFVGSGFRSKDTKATIELLGFVKSYYGIIMEQLVVVQQPQFRKHCYNESKTILSKHKINKVHHAKDAFAHLIAYCIKEHGYEKKYDLPS